MRLLILGGVLLAATAFAAEKQKMVVMDVAVYDATATNAAGQEAMTKLGRIATEQVATSLTEHGFDVLGSSDIAAIVGAERQRQMMGCNESSNECLAELSGALGAPYIVTGSLSRAGKGLQLDLKLIETSSSKVLARQGRALADEGEIFSGVKETVGQLLTSAKLISAKAPRSRTAPLVVTGVGAAVAIGGGALFLVQSSSTDALLGDLQTHAVAIDQATSRRSTIMTERTVATGLVIGGGAVAAAGLVWFLVSGPTDVAPVSVVATSHGALLTWGGTW